MRCGGGKGLTLVELLVVTSIIAMLASLLLSVLGGIRERGRQTACASNLRQIGVATQSYFGDWEEMLLRYHATATSTIYHPWQWLLVPYLPGREVWICPSVRYPGLPDLWAKAVPGMFIQAHGRRPLPVSYGMNMWLTAGFADATSEADGPSLLLMREPARYLLAGEVEDGTVFHLRACVEQFVREWRRDLVRRFPELGEVSGGLVRHHEDRTNLLFMDGHVEALRISQTLVPQQRWWPPELRVWKDANYPSLQESALQLQRDASGWVSALSPPCR